MKTFKTMKNVIGFFQTDDFFLEYVQRLIDAGVICVYAGDIKETEKMVSDEFYERLCQVFGILDVDQR